MNGVGSLWRKIYGSAVIATSWKSQLQIPFLPKEKVEDLRDQRLRSIVRYSAKTVPYYRELFHREGIDPDSIRTVNDLQRLSILKKDTVRTTPDSLISETSAGKNSIPFFSSGSTGRPIRVQQDRDSLLLNIAFGERERAAVIRMCGGSFRPKEVYVGYETSTFKNVISFYETNVLFPVRPKRRFVSMTEPIENIVTVLNQDQPDILTGYGGWIHLFLKTLIARRIEFPLPKMIMYMGEALPPGGRDLIENHLGIPLLSRYNSIEAFKIGFYCEKRTGFHLHEDLCHVRIAGSNGETLPPGEQGQIVISNLVNRGSVILNYPIGDLGAISPNSCSCGRTSRILSELEGRVEDIVPLKDGRFIHPRMIWKVFKHQPDLIQYQVVQHEQTRFELRIAAKDEEAYQRILHSALPELQNLLGPDACIEANWYKEFPRESGQKFRAVASHVKAFGS